jgi:curli biogenesis system outer membrane secretion channel CsgG
MYLVTDFRISFSHVFLFLALIVSCWMNSAFSAIDATTHVDQPASESPSIGLKRKVGIARFSNETQSGNTFLVDDSGDRLGKQAADILSARLAETGHFLMFERLDADEVSTEKMLAGLKEKAVSIDYLIVGSVSEFGRSNESESGIFQRTKIQKAYSKVNVRLIDVTTGRIIYAAEGAGEATSEAKKTFGVGASAGYDQSLTDKSMSAAISQVISNLVERMTSAPWRSYLLSYETPSYIISGGDSQGLKPGMRLFVYKKGRSVMNPQTGSKVELPGSRAGELRVDLSFGEDEFNELSMATLVSGEITGPLDNYYILEK